MAVDLHRRPVRRALRRNVGKVPPPVLLRHLQVAVEQLAPARARGAALLGPLFAEVWRRASDAVWSVAELCELGLVRAVDARATGRALADLAAAGGGLGCWVLHRADPPGKKLREGRLWRLQRRW
jgi:hypothetical protein